MSRKLTHGGGTCNRCGKICRNGWQVVRLQTPSPKPRMRELIRYLDSGGKLLDFLKAEAAAAGTNLTAVCHKSGVHRQTVEQWKKGLPRSLEVFIAVLRAIENETPEE